MTNINTIVEDVKEILEISNTFLSAHRWLNPKTKEYWQKLLASPGAQNIDNVKDLVNSKFRYISRGLQKINANNYIIHKNKNSNLQMDKEKVSNAQLDRKRTREFIKQVKKELIDIKNKISNSNDHTDRMDIIRPPDLF